MFSWFVYDYLWCDCIARVVCYCLVGGRWFVIVIDGMPGGLLGVLFGMIVALLFGKVPKVCFVIFDFFRDCCGCMFGL